MTIDGIRERESASRRPEARRGVSGQADLQPEPDPTITLERLQAALLGTTGNIVQAAKILGVSRPTLYDLMHRFGLK